MPKIEIHSITLEAYCVLHRQFLLDTYFLNDEHHLSGNELLKLKYFEKKK